MPPSILIAGIGNIFNRDDAFGVEVVSKLAREPLPTHVRAVDFGIRGFDLVLALLEGYDLTIFVDAASRGGRSGTLYTIVPDLSRLECESSAVENAHGLDPSKVLAWAKSLGATFKHVLVIGCEPADLDGDSGRIGLSEIVQSAVDPAIETIRSLIKNFNEQWTDLPSEVGRMQI